MKKPLLLSVVASFITLQAAEGATVQLIYPDPPLPAEARYLEVLSNDPALRELGIDIVALGVPVDFIASDGWHDQYDLAISRLSIESAAGQRGSAFVGLLSYPVLAADARLQHMVQDSPAAALVAAEIGTEHSFPLGFFVGDASSFVAADAFVETLAGKDIVVTAPDLVDVWNAVGAKAMFAEPIQAGQLVARQIGGFDASLAGTSAWGELRSPGSYLLADFRRESGVLLVSAKFWNEVSPSRRVAIEQALDRASASQYAAELETSEQVLEVLASEMGAKVVNGGWNIEAFEQSFLKLYGGGQGEEALSLLLTSERPGRDGGSSSIDPDETIKTASVFYVTDRRSFPEEAELRYRYGARTHQMTAEVHCGRLGYAPLPGALGQYDGELRHRDDGQTAASVSDCAQLVASQSSTLIIFIHGFASTFEHSLRRVLSLARDLRLDAASSLAVWSWPSQGNHAAYIYDGESAVESAENLVDFVTAIDALGSVQTLVVVSHSMGGRLAERAIAAARPSRDRLQFVFVAPDVPTDRFARRVGSAKARVTLYASDNDFALWFSSRLNEYARAGEGGPRLLVIPELETVDLSNLNTVPLMAAHGHALDLPEAFDDLSSLVRSGLPAQDRGLTALQRRGLPYYELAR